MPDLCPGVRSQRKATNAAKVRQLTRSGQMDGSLSTDDHPSWRCGRAIVALVADHQRTRLSACVEYSAAPGCHRGGATTHGWPAWLECARSVGGPTPRCLGGPRTGLSPQPPPALPMLRYGRGLELGTETLSCHALGFCGSPEEALKAIPLVRAETLLSRH